MAFELFAAVEGVPLSGFGLAGGRGGEGVIACATREYHVIYSVFLLLRFWRRSHEYGARFKVCVFYSVSCVKEAECTGIRSISWMPDMSLFFDEVVLKQFARKRFLHERLLYLPKRLRNSLV